jgi:hypothetical protein
MIQKIGNAMKKMAQRSMWRGNREDAMSIESHGMYGLRNNLVGKGQNTTQQNTNTNSNTASTHLKNVTANTTAQHVNTSNQKTSLGDNILDALK